MREEGLEVLPKVVVRRRSGGTVDDGGGAQFIWEVSATHAPWRASWR